MKNSNMNKLILYIYKKTLCISSGEVNLIIFVIMYCKINEERE